MTELLDKIEFLEKTTLELQGMLVVAAFALLAGLLVLLRRVGSRGKGDWLRRLDRATPWGNGLRRRCLSPFPRGDAQEGTGSVATIAPRLGETACGDGACPPFLATPGGKKGDRHRGGDVSPTAKTTCATEPVPLFRRRRPLRRAWNQLARRRCLALLVVAASAIAAVAAFAQCCGPRQPESHDEFSYLLAADTFAAGRLTNPPHPFWQHFESMHILQQPTYMSKYPPGPGLAMALGQRLAGSPILGVQLAVAAACAAICWMLQGLLPPRWALLGGCLAVVWLAPTYWAQTYCPGALAACGGALLYGALPRIVRGGHGLNAAALALGAILLMFTRPYEGLVASLPAAVVLAVWLGRSGWRWVVATAMRCTLPALLVLVPATVWLGCYHAAVTGSALRMPYQVHDASYAACPLFFWQALGPAPAYRHAAMADYYVGWERDRFERKRWLRGLNGSAGTKLWVFFKFFVGPAFVVPVAGLWLSARKPWLLLAAVTCGLVLLALTQTLYLHPHYAAPVAGLVFVQVVTGLRYLRLWHRRGAQTGRILAAGVVAVMAAGFFIPLAAAWAGPPPRDTPRTRVLHRLEALGDRHLVFVRYAPGHECHLEWVYNRADIDAAPVVWAREISPAEDRKLRDYFHDRCAWILLADAEPPRLAPYDAPTQGKGTVPFSLRENRDSPLRENRDSPQAAPRAPTSW